MNPAEDSLQVDLYNTLGPQDNPDGDGAAIYNLFGYVYGALLDSPRSLKYRSKWTNRATANLAYGPVSLTANYRYKSQVLAIDQFLFVAIPGSSDFLKAHPKGFAIMDVVLGMDVMKGMKVSLNCDNVLNKEWAELPGIMGAQRNYTLQLQYVF
jgi:outer membrane cobalamin receptor